MTESLFYNKNTNKWEIMGLNFVKDASSPSTPTDAYTKTEVNNLLSGKLDASTYNLEKSNFASKAEVSNKLDKSKESTFATKTDLNSKLNVSTYDSEKLEFASKTEVSTKLDTDTYVADRSNFATKGEVALKHNTVGPNGSKIYYNSLNLLEADNFSINLSSPTTLTFQNPNNAGQSGVIKVEGAKNITGFNNNIITSADKSKFKNIEYFAYFVFSGAEILLNEIHQRD
jgi:hypothetical protein|nr:MAG TPA: hypothetical protein [Bacteriophage sp.]